MITLDPNRSSNESDVEQKFIYQFLSDAGYLDYPSSLIKTKQFLVPLKSDKKFGIAGGYYPDYLVWMSGYPVMIVEAKHPEREVITGFREASQYARQVNNGYQHGFNPCIRIISCNGVDLWAGFPDQDDPQITTKVADLVINSQVLSDLIAFCGVRAIERLHFEATKILRAHDYTRPFSLSGGMALINSKKQLNSFAADLSPILRRYFSSRAQENIAEIIEKAYVSSAELTEYDRVLESLLKDRVAPRRDTIIKPIRTTKSDEKQLTSVIKEYAESKETYGQLQIIQGGVGSGKSLFARRYRHLLIPQDIAARTYWSFVDFNNSPPSLDRAEDWLCRAFIDSFENENPSLHIYEMEVQKGIFSRKIQQRRSIYESLRGAGDAEELKARAADLREWQDSPKLFAEGLATYVGPGRGENLIVVMDNVDKLDLQEQLKAFQLTLWFLDISKAFVIIQMRDETYERYKNRPPLDTYRSSIAFHIAPPRFIDVVKRRLELAIEFLVAHANKTQTYTLENGVKIILPEGEVGRFLRLLYTHLFSERRNMARVLEALAGRDVRKALDMFASIVTSGHISTEAITSNTIGAGEVRIADYHVIRVLMRGDYRFFSDVSGVVSNIFYFDPDWDGADNFICIEGLYFLAMSRKMQGEIGLEGYFSVARVADELERIGYPRPAALKAIQWLLKKELIIADNYSFVDVKESDCVKILASGFMHLRVLCERIEYLYGILTVTQISDMKTAVALADFINRESQRGYCTRRDQVNAVEKFSEYLKYEYARNRERNPFNDPDRSGAAYVIRLIENELRRARTAQLPGRGPQNELDLQ